VHPLEEASGFRALLLLEEPKYSIEQIAAKTGKSPLYVASRFKLTELVAVVVEVFYREEIGVGHALLLAKLQPGQQVQALAAYFKEDWSAGGQEAKRILLPLRNLHFWIESSLGSRLLPDRAAGVSFAPGKIKVVSTRYFLCAIDTDRKC
jgi:ParB family transcriptional regulator, chromosome partitioning protein